MIRIDTTRYDVAESDRAVPERLSKTRSPRQTMTSELKTGQQRHSGLPAPQGPPAAFGRVDRVLGCRRVAGVERAGALIRRVAVRFGLEVIEVMAWSRASRSRSADARAASACAACR